MSSSNNKFCQNLTRKIRNLTNDNILGRRLLNDHYVIASVE